METNRELGRYIRVSRKKEDKFERIKNDQLSPFNKLNQRDVYMFAAAVGLYFNLRKPLDKDTKDLALFSDLPDRYHLLADVIALKANNYDVDKIVDGVVVVPILNEFANGGIDKLYEMIMNKTDTKELQEKILEIMSKND